MREIYLDRSENELDAARALLELSKDDALKRKLAIEGGRTFYNNSISCAYYAMFYAAKAYLASKDISTGPPQEHRQVYEQLRALAGEGEVDRQLLVAYRKLVIRAEELLRMYSCEREKRGTYTYHRLAETNRPVAEESLRHATGFHLHVRKMLGAV
ncbi:MAG: HEPN domain-containing protein [Candidatus Woesearchaeota archaeon]